MNVKELEKIFEKTQISTSAHQKCVIMLIDIYKKTPRAEFLSVFTKFLYCVVSQKIENAVYTKRSINFISLFCSDVAKKEEKENETHEFLTSVVGKTLEWSSLDVYDLRHNSCYLLAMVLQDIGEEVQLEICLIDEIQRVLLERMQESKTAIRLVAMSALVRLQDPQNFECPVINAYLEALLSGNTQIRKDAVERIAPNMVTLSKIKDRIRDVDPGVRMAAFHKCADIGPLSFRIIDRHNILLCGFKETNEKVKTKFLEYLLPKWLTAYKGNYLKFIEALKLIADEKDIVKMSSVCKDLITEFFNKHPIDDLIEALPINDDKLIDIKNLNNEVTLFWSILISLLRDSDLGDHLNRILPELTPFCHYISNVITANSTDKMDEWKFFEYQFDLLNLFEIAENYDYSDEVGRRTIRSLTVKLLQNHTFTPKLTKKLVSIAHKCSSTTEFFINDMCQLISDIREPLTDEPMSQDHSREHDFKLAELRVKINIAEERQNEAIHERDYKTAQELDDQLINLKNQLINLTSLTNTEKVRAVKSDDETLCQCLDILISVMELPAVNKLTPSLASCRDNFLVPLISTKGAEPHWRMLRCLGLFSIIDRAMADEYAKLLCIPIATYRTIPANNVSALVTSVSAVTDLISIYGVDIVSQGEETINATSDSIGKRKLYTNDTEEDPKKVDNMTLSYIFEIFLDMLDDEREEIRHKAILAISILVKRSFTMTPTLLSRILLKWYSPLTAQQDGHLQVYLGLLINEYMRQTTSGEIMKEAIIPTLDAITRAPRNSPLVDIEIENVLMFFSEMMNVMLRKDDLRILALDLCMKISEKPTDRIVLYLAKLLFHLDIDQINATLKPELAERAEMLLENLPDKWSKKYVEKFIARLRQSTQTNSTVNTTNTTLHTTKSRDTVNGNETDKEENVLRAVPDSEFNMQKKPQQIKRRKKENGKICVVAVERLDLSKKNLNVANETTLSKSNLSVANETTLHTILEASAEMEIDENLTIESVTSDSSKKSTRSNIVISETSDSELSNDNEPRRSTRCRKKRIIL